MLGTAHLSKKKIITLRNLDPMEAMHSFKSQDLQAYVNIGISTPKLQSALITGEPSRTERIPLSIHHGEVRGSETEEAGSNPSGVVRQRQIAVRRHAPG